MSLRVIVLEITGNGPVFRMTRYSSGSSLHANTPGLIDQTGGCRHLNGAHIEEIMETKPIKCPYPKVFGIAVNSHFLIRKWPE
jgi:hypothetical protein